MERTLPSSAFAENKDLAFVASINVVNDFNRGISQNIGRKTLFEKNRGWTREYPTINMVDEDFKLKPMADKAIKKFRDLNPLAMSGPMFIDAVQHLYVELSAVYDIPPPPVSHEGPWTGDTGTSNYTVHSIRLHGKKSLSTLFHEYAHAIGYGETGAVWWSTNIVRIYWPERYENMIKNQAYPYKVANAPKTPEQADEFRKKEPLEIQRPKKDEKKPVEKPVEEVTKAA